MPAGAIPKDGPSAGVTMATAICSLVTGTPVNTDVAMTGEVTLTGQVLPIGGLKEKTLAAQRAGITTVILPSRNEADLEDVPEELRKDMTFVPVERVEQVWQAAMGLSLDSKAVELIEAGELIEEAGELISRARGKAAAVKRQVAADAAREPRAGAERPRGQPQRRGQGRRSPRRRGPSARRRARARPRRPRRRAAAAAASAEPRPPPGAKSARGGGEA